MKRQNKRINSSYVSYPKLTPVLGNKDFLCTNLLS